MSKINEIFTFTKLINKTTESIFENMCEIFQSLTFYSESQEINKDVFVIYENSINLLISTFENYLNLYNNVDILWKPNQTHGSFYNLKKIINYKKIKLIKFENNEYNHYIKSFGTNPYSLALLYGDDEFVFKRLNENNSVGEALKILNYNIDKLTGLNNKIKIELIKQKKILKINQVKLHQECSIKEISDSDSFYYSDLSEN